jgi:hypothetical protein
VAAAVLLPVALSDAPVVLDAALDPPAAAATVAASGPAWAWGALGLISWAPEWAAAAAPAAAATAA